MGSTYSFTELKCTCTSKYSNVFCFTASGRNSSGVARVEISWAERASCMQVNHKNNYHFVLYCMYLINMISCILFILYYCTVELCPTTCATAWMRTAGCIQCRTGDQSGYSGFTRSRKLNTKKTNRLEHHLITHIEEDIYYTIHLSHMLCNISFFFQEEPTLCYAMLWSVSCVGSICFLN